jgi:hypothetical protein
MGTTLDVVLVAGAEAFVAHVGDSRTYLLRDGRSSQITTDHTVAEVLVIEGKLTIEEAQVSPLRTILVNAIGVSADVGVEMAHVALKKGDRLLLCSDGLHDYFPVEEEIAQRMAADKPGEALAEMVELAKTRGGHDNITAIAVHILDVIQPSTPEGVSNDSTQPIDLTGNPFAGDEPTETAGDNIAVAHGGALSASNLRQTQPMRALGEAPTVPPPLQVKDAAAATEVSTQPMTGAVEATAEAVANAGGAPPADAQSADGVPGEPSPTADTGRIAMPDKE